MRMAFHHVHSGWLTKSPPEKKPPGRLKLFKARQHMEGADKMEWETEHHVPQTEFLDHHPSSPAVTYVCNEQRQHWRRRYFVLSSCQSQSPGGGQEAPPAYYLHYYDNDRSPKKSREKGCIDLSSCDEILAELESDCYENVFSLRTQHKGRTRTYCLAADSVEEMNQWINCLIKVLQMDDFDPLTTGPDTPFQKPSPCVRHGTYPLNRSGYSPHQTSNSSDAAKSPSIFGAELAGTRISLSCSSIVQTSPRSPYLRGAEDGSDTDPSPPPSLPAKTLRNRLRDIDGGDWRASEFRGVHSPEATDPEFRSGGGGGGGDSVLHDYDFLPAGRRSVRWNHDDGAFQFPTNTSLSDDELLSSPDDFAQRKSTSSYSDAFESADDQLCHLKSDSSPFSTSIQVTQRTRSFRRSATRSDPHQKSVVASTDQLEVKEQI